MKLKEIGKSGIFASEISIGTFGMGGGTAWSDTGNDTAASVRLLEEAYDRGVTFFDSAPVYGGGQAEEILAQAIRLLPERIHNECLFLFVGKNLDPDIFRHIEDLQREYPDSVRHIPAIPREEIFSLYRQADAVICSSRDDPMPTFMAETMMVSGVCICSENTGTAGVIEHGVNGFLYPDDDPAKLAACIQAVVESGDLTQVRDNGRRLFEEVFTMDIFKQNLLRCVAQCIGETEDA